MADRLEITGGPTEIASPETAFRVFLYVVKQGEAERLVHVEISAELMASSNPHHPLVETLVRTRGRSVLEECLFRGRVLKKPLRVGYSTQTFGE